MERRGSTRTAGRAGNSTTGRLFSSSSRNLNPVPEESSRLQSQHRTGLHTSIPPMSPVSAAATSTSDYLQQLDDDAVFARIILLYRKYFHLWHERARRHADDRQILAAQAMAHYRRILQQKALREWLFVTKERQTEHARDIYLIGAAFSTWAHKTAAIINRSNEMRERIMARKYFNAWRSIVLNNEKKVRMFQLTNALYHWRMALFRRRQQEQSAAQVYEMNLVSRFRKIWWYQACEEVAPGLHNNFLLREAVSTWHQQTAAIVHNHRVAKRLFQTRLANRIFQLWLGRTDDLLDMGVDAVDHRDWSTTRKHLEIWRRQTQYAPAVLHVTDVINRRLASSCLNAWRFRYRQCLAAKSLLRAHTIKHYFRQWNLTLRHNILVIQHEERILVDTLYTWVLHTRYLIFKKRVKNWLLAKSSLSHWRQKTKALLRTRRHNNHHAIHTLKKHLITTFFRAWQNRLADNLAIEARAEQFYHRNLLRKTLTVWTTRTRYIQTLQTWVTPARRYLLLRNQLRVWRTSFEQLKRNKMKRAYKQVQHGRRLRLLATIANHWYSRTEIVGRMHLSAEDFYSSRVALTAQWAMHAWRDRLAYVAQLNRVQESWRNPSLLGSYFYEWLQKMMDLSDLEELAAKHYNKRAIASAATLFRRWQAQSFVLKTKETTAELIGERFAKRRVLGLIRRWLKRAKEMEKFRERLDEDEEYNGGTVERSEASMEWEQLRQSQDEAAIDESMLEDEDNGNDILDTSPTPTPISIRSSVNNPGRSTPYAPFKSSIFLGQSSENVRDLGTANQTPQAQSEVFHRRLLRSPARSTSKTRMERTPFPTRTPMLSSIPLLLPDARSSIFSSATGGRATQQLLQTPRDRAARAREVMFGMASSSRELFKTPTSPIQGRSYPQSAAVSESSGTQQRPSSPAFHVSIAEGRFSFVSEGSATPEGSPIRRPQPFTPQATFASNAPSTNKRTAFRVNSDESASLPGISSMATPRVGRSLFARRNLLHEETQGKGKGRAATP